MTKITTITDITPDHLALLKKHGFKWYKDGTTDTVVANCIDDVVAAPNGFTVVYNSNAVIKTSTAVVEAIELPEDLEATWIYVKWSEITDVRK